MTQLLDDLKQAATPAPPRDFAPGVIYSGGMPSQITTPAVEALEGQDDWDAAVKAMGIILPEGFTLQLVEAQYAYNAAAWKRDPEDRGRKDTAYTAPSHLWRYKFKVVLKSLRADPDLHKLQREATKKIAGRALKVFDPMSTMVINLADFQTGKTDERGGTAELIERSEKALALVLERIKRLRPAEILLIDNGDSTEGFESSPNAERTSDLQQTEQIRVWRRIFWRWIEALSRLRLPMKVISVPSNHCSVRRGKNNLGPAGDDWGLEVLSQVADMASTNPERFGHIEFIEPATKHDQHVTLTLIGGKILSAAHGHQASSPNTLVDWAKKQGRSSIGLSDIVVVGHFHHLRVVTYGDNQTLVVCPTMDPGSSWFTPSSGERSDPGVLTFMVDSSGWHSLDVAWAA